MNHKRQKVSSHTSRSSGVVIPEIDDS